MVEKENNSQSLDLKGSLRVVEGWPKEGVNFIDITTVLEDRDTFSYAVDKMIELITDLDEKPDKIAAVDARGFVFGGVIANRLNLGLSLVRKPGKLPYDTISEEYEKEYGKDTLIMNVDTIKPGEKVVVVDDLLASGGTAEAAAKLVEREGGEVVGMIFMVNLPFLHGSERLSQYNPRWLVEYDKE